MNFYADTTTTTTTSTLFHYQNYCMNLYLSIPSKTQCPVKAHHESCGCDDKRPPRPLTYVPLRVRYTLSHRKLTSH